MTEKTRRRSPRILVLTGLALFTLYSLAPMWFLLVSATKSQHDLYNTNGLWFARFRLWQNLEQLFTYDGGIFLRWMGNSLFYGLASTTGMTAICVACGYGLAMYRFRGRGVLMACIIGSFLVPGALLTIPSFVLFTHLGLVDTPWAVILPGFFARSRSTWPRCTRRAPSRRSCSRPPASTAPASTGSSSRSACG